MDSPHHTRKSPRKTAIIHIYKPLSLSQAKKLKDQKNKTYNTRDSLVVTDPTTSLALRGLCLGERTGPSVLHGLWSYVPDVTSRATYHARRSNARAPDLPISRSSDPPSAASVNFVCMLWREQTRKALRPKVTYMMYNAEGYAKRYFFLKLVRFQFDWRGPFTEFNFSMSSMHQHIHGCRDC